MPRTKSENELLCEAFAGGKRIPITEKVSARVRRIGDATKSESMMAGGDTSDPGTEYEAKVWDAGVVNGNNRIYEPECMAANVDRLRPKMGEGRLCGSVDHGTGLTNQAIIWRDIRDPHAAAFGKFEIIPTSSGKDLKVMCDSGVDIGFSTYGYGSAHVPTDAERQKYNLPAYDPDRDGIPGDDENPYTGPVVMGRDYELVKIDAVDDPSVNDARLVQKQSREGGNVATEGEGRPVSEAKRQVCDAGLHWIRRGSCGHIISQCTCESEEKYTVWEDHQCEECGGVRDGMTVDQFKKTIAESKSIRGVVSEGKQEPLPQTYFKYVKGKGGNSFEPIGDIAIAKELTSNAFEIIPTYGGVRFVRKPIQTDELYHFDGSPMEAVLKEINDFWNSKPEYEKYGVMFHRGIMMHGAPGTGKTSAVNQAVEMVTNAGHVVFYGRSIGTLKEALSAFHEVEPDRKVVVVLEDADEYVGYQEREMLNLLDGADTVEGVLYLATSNYLNRFPERLLRPGRFDKKVHIGPPNLAGRKAYLQNKLGKVEAAEEIERLAKETEGLSFGHLRELITAVYALKEPKSEVLARLKGTARRHADSSSRLQGQMESQQPTQESSGGSIHLNHACVGKAMAAARAGKIDHGSFDGDATERTAANADKFLGIDSEATPDEKAHYKFPIFTGDKVSAKGVATAGHYSDGTNSEIHAATVKISDAIKAHEGDKGAKKDDRNVVPSKAQTESKDMEKQIVEQLNSLFKVASTVEGFEAPHREVLPAEIAAQLESKDKAIADLQSEIEKAKAANVELQKKLDAIDAERAEEKRLADVMTKASELLKDNHFADAILDDIKEASTDKAFTAEKVEAVVKARTTKYEKVAGAHLTGPLPVGVQGRHLTDADIADELTEEERAQEEAAKTDEENARVKPAEELSFGKKTK